LERRRKRLNITRRVDGRKEGQELKKDTYAIAMHLPASHSQQISSTNPVKISLSPAKTRRGRLLGEDFLMWHWFLQQGGQLSDIDLCVEIL